MSRQNHVASIDELHAATSSGSVVDCAVYFFSLLLQPIGPSLRKKTYPVVDRRLFKPPAKSESVNPIKWRFNLPS